MITLSIEYSNKADLERELILNSFNDYDIVKEEILKKIDDLKKLIISNVENYINNNIEIESIKKVPIKMHGKDFYYSQRSVRVNILTNYVSFNEELTFWYLFNKVDKTICISQVYLSNWKYYIKTTLNAK